ncbi:hypothetical protein BDQ17DRAFT_1430225 [Cyathus striatus]|nr:hypothetical protein BDQ17DRAFT_1430225 [Cyathus striatus]
MSAFKISPEDMAQCQEIATKAANEAAVNALVEAIAEVQQRADEEVRRVEAEAEEAARRAEEEAKTRCVAEEAEVTRRAEEEKRAEADAETSRHSLTPAMSVDQAIPLDPDTDFPMALPEGPVPPFSILDSVTTSSSPATVKEDELDDDYIPPRLDLSSISSKRKVVPQPTTTFAPASKRSKVGNVEVVIPVSKFTPHPEPPTPSELESASGYHLHDHSTSALTATLAPAPLPAKAVSSSLKPTAKSSFKAAGKKKAKCTPEEMPQFTSADSIDVDLLQDNVHKLLKYFGARICTNCISQGRECVPRGYGVKCSACSGVSTSHCSFAIPSPNTEFALSIAHCVGNSSTFALNDACRTLDLSRTHAYHALLAAELEHIEYARNCVTMVHHLRDIAKFHSFTHLQTVHSISSSFSLEALANLVKLAANLNSWLPDRAALFSLETALERVFTLHTLNLHASSVPSLTGFPSITETVAIQDFSDSLRPRNLQELGGIFGNPQLYSLSLEDYHVSDPSGSSSIRATREGNTDYELAVGWYKIPCILLAILQHSCYPSLPSSCLLPTFPLYFFVTVMADNFPSEAAFLDTAHGLCMKVGQWQGQRDMLSSVQLHTELYKEAAMLKMLLEYAEVFPAMLEHSIVEEVVRKSRSLYIFLENRYKLAKPAGLFTLLEQAWGAIELRLSATEALAAILIPDIIPAPTAPPATPVTSRRPISSKSSGVVADVDDDKGVHVTSMTSPTSSVVDTEHFNAMEVDDEAKASMKTVKLSFDAIPNLDRNSPAYRQAERLRKGKHPKTDKDEASRKHPRLVLPLPRTPSECLTFARSMMDHLLSLNKIDQVPVPSHLMGMHQAETLMCTAQSIQQLYKTFIDTNADIEKYLKYSDTHGSSAKGFRRE